MDVDHVTNACRPAQEIDIAADTADALRGWHRQVREALALLDTPKHSEAVRGLVAWYERVFFVAAYAENPPVAGLDVVVDELSLARQPFDLLRALAQARWAIRVGEELVHWRQCLRSFGPDSLLLGPAKNRLEHALDKARRQLDSPPNA